MAKTSMKIKQQREPKFSTRAYNRCKICGRPHAYLRKYGICRICFRELAYKGQIPGVKKASWQISFRLTRRAFPSRSRRSGLNVQKLSQGRPCAAPTTAFE